MVEERAGDYDMSYSDAVGLGCSLDNAIRFKMKSLEGLDVGETRKPVEVGVNCPSCPREGCLQRQLPLRGGAPLLDADTYPVSRAYRLTY